VKAFLTVPEAAPRRLAAGARLGLILLLLPLAVTAASAQQATPPPPAPSPLTMEQAVAVALESNPEVRTMDAERRMAAAGARMARSMTRPQVSANGYAGTGTMENIVSTTPSVMPTNYGMVPPKPFAVGNLTLMVPLYTGGRLAGTVRAAGAREAAAGADAAETRAQVALMVREAYLGVLLAGEMVSVAQARLDAATAMREVARAQFDAGKGILASVQRADAERADAERMLLAARNDREKMLLELRAAMGVALDAPLLPAGTLASAAAAEPSPPARALDDWLRQAREGRPALRAREARTEEARAIALSARGSRLPQVYGMAMGDAFSSREMGSGSGHTVAVALSLPLVDGGQRRAEADEARAGEERAASQRRAEELRVEREVRSAWLDSETAARSLAAAVAGLDAAQAAYDVIALRVQNQKSILVEQMEALATLTQARAGVARARFDQALAAARLLRAAGRE